MDLKTCTGYPFDEVASAFQKCIRRGLEEEALYWGSELFISGYEAYLWKRILIITSEDIGLANPDLPQNIRALYQNWLDLKEGKDLRCERSMFVFHAILLLVRSPKSRIVDNARNLFQKMDRRQPDNHKEIPSFALDKHTKRGRLQGAKADSFWSEDGGSKLENVAGLDDPYYERAKELSLSGAKLQFRQSQSNDDPQDENPQLNMF
ncbi:MAG: hypothetical protein ONB55_21920 [candidate division KSB1 bacterium]|nr:hypothetical protein [candidate division KSB1 bacterium]